jgi:NADPH:quinone reductase-like Zn-dependent oxidoreductase
MDEKTKMEALLLDAELKTASISLINIPTPGPGEVLVKVHAIALNPVDSLYTYNPLGKTGRVVGSDFAGTVHHAPSASPFQHGQRVAGFLQGACSRNDRPGAFAEYIICPADLLWLVPDDMTLEQAAAISLCALTAAQAVFLRLGLTAPFDLPSDSFLAPAYVTPRTRDILHVLIYGASTSVGLYAAQLIRRAATASGQHIVLMGTASKARFPLLQTEPYAYDFLFDYHDASWPTDVLLHTKNKGIDLALDCISEGSSVAAVSSTLDQAGKLAVTRSLEGGAWDSTSLKDRVMPSYGAVWEGLGERVEYQGFVLPVSASSRAFTVAFYQWLSRGDGKVEANPVRLMPGGLAKVVPDGFALLGSGSMGDRVNERKEDWMKPVSAEKMVYRLGDGSA